MQATKTSDENDQLRVLLWMVDGDKVPGGHRVQIDQTAAHLAELGVEVEVSFAADVGLDGFDIVQGFTLPLKSMRRCRENHLPVVLSTIYWGRDYTTGQHRTGDFRATWINRIRLGLALLRSSLRGRVSEKCEVIIDHLTQKKIAYEMAALLLPNSKSEAEAIRHELGVTTPCHVVPNAVDENKFMVGLEKAPRDHVLFSGRFEPHKNQLGLIRALKNEPWPVVLVGKPHPHHPSYYEQCRREAPPHFRVLDGVAHEELAPLYRAARVHVLPSWFETTGLVSLEAALCGCNVVTTDRGYARDYFGDLAWYCDPASPTSIRAAVQAAWDAPVNPALRTHVLNHFTWKHTAQATLEAFHKVLARPARGTFTGTEA